MTDVTVKDGTLSVQEYGDTRAEASVVLVHGLGYSSDVWTEVAERLARHARVVTFDLPGHGRSTASPESGEDVRTDVVALIRHLELERPILVGHDYGGYVVTAVAAEHHDLVGGVVVVDWPTVLPHEQAVAWLAEVRGDDVLDFMTERFALGAEGPDQASLETFLDGLIDRVDADWMTAETGRDHARSGLARSVLVRPDGSWVRRPTRTEVENATRVAEDSSVYPDVRIYDRITCPLVFVHPTEGMYADVLPALEQITAAPGRGVRVIDGAGHHVEQTHPHEVAAAVTALLEEAAAGG